MIVSFADKETEALFRGEPVARFRNVERVARRKLLVLHAAPTIETLKVPPGNRLESLAGKRKGSSASALTISGVFAFAGCEMASATWKSSTITNELANESEIGRNSPR